MRLYFARHGEAECNLTGEFSNTGLKHPLTAKGVQQAHALAARLAEAGVHHIYASPLLRARQTAQIVGDALGLAYEASDALREYSTGVLEGRTDQAAWDIYWQVVEAWFERGDWQQRIEGGESMIDMQRRFVPFIAEITQRFGDQPGAVLLISHGGLYRCMLPLVLANLDHHFVKTRHIDNTAYVLAERQAGRWWCVEWCGEKVE